LPALPEIFGFSAFQLTMTGQKESSAVAREPTAGQSKVRDGRPPAKQGAMSEPKTVATTIVHFFNNIFKSIACRALCRPVRCGAVQPARRRFFGRVHWRAPH